jgi:hypothetical protein
MDAGPKVRFRRSISPVHEHLLCWLLAFVLENHADDVTQDVTLRFTT